MIMLARIQVSTSGANVLGKKERERERGRTRERKKEGEGERLRKKVW